GQDPEEPTGGRDPSRGSFARNDPRADTHGRGDLEDAQHVVEPSRAAEILDQEVRTDAHARSGGVKGPPRECVVPGEAGGGGQRGRGPGDPARKEVLRNLGLPDGLLDDRLAVIGKRRLSRHSSPPAKAKATPAASKVAAAAAALQIVPRFRVGSTG